MKQVLNGNTDIGELIPSTTYHWSVKLCRNYFRKTKLEIIENQNVKDVFGSLIPSEQLLQ